MLQRTTFGSGVLPVLRGGFLALSLGATLSAAACTTSTPLSFYCDLQADCAEEMQWVFSRSECEHDAEFATEQAKSAGCGKDFDEMALCIKELGLECGEDYEVVIAKECRKEQEDLDGCLEDARRDEAKKKKRNPSNPPPDETPALPSSANAYCDKLGECGGGTSAADTCKSSFATAAQAASTAGCSDEYAAIFDCASALECSEINNFQSACESEYTAYTNCAN